MKITAATGCRGRRVHGRADDEILVFSSGGNIIRMGVNEISAQGRDATGVRVARLARRRDRGAVAPVLEADAGEDTRRWRSAADDSRHGRRRVLERAPWPPVVRPTRSSCTDDRCRRRPTATGAAQRDGGEAAPVRGPTPRRCLSRVGRRYRQTIHRVDLWSVLKIVGVLLHLRRWPSSWWRSSRSGSIADAAGVIAQRREVLRRPAADARTSRSSTARSCAARCSSAAVVVVLLDRDHGDRGRVLQRVRRALRRRRDHDRRRRVGAERPGRASPAGYALSPLSGAIAQSVRAHP